MLAQPGAIGQRQVGGAAAEQWMGIAQIVAQRYAPDAFREIGRAVARVDEVTEDGLERARTAAWPHDGHLRARPVEYPRAERMPLGRVAVGESVRRVATDGRGELPSQIHRVAQPEVQALAAQWRVDVRGVAGEQHTALAIRRR